MSLVTKSTRRLSPFLTVLAIFAVLCLSLAVFFALRKLENQNARASFEIVAQERFDHLQTNITLTSNSLVSLGALFDGSSDITRQRFGRFARDLAGSRQRHPGPGMDSENPESPPPGQREFRSPPRRSSLLS